LNKTNMLLKSSTIRTTAAVALAGAVFNQASAAWITGDVSFSGTAILNGSPLAATAITAYLGSTVGDGSGTYSGTDGDSVNFAPFTFLPPVNGSFPVTLWSFYDSTKNETFTFQALALNASAVASIGGITFINIQGIGIARASGSTSYSDTPGSFSLSFSSTKATGTFQAYTVVPEPTTYTMVAGLGLVGFGLLRRRS